MKINLHTKFNIGDTAYVYVFERLTTVTITNITLKIDTEKTEIYYEVDDSLIQVEAESNLFTKEEAEEKEKVKSIV